VVPEITPPTIDPPSAESADTYARPWPTMETGVSGVHARDAIKASAPENPESEGNREWARLCRCGSPPAEPD